MPSPSLRLLPGASSNDRIIGVAVTLAVHLALILAWQMASRLPPMSPEGSDEAMQWLTLPPPVRRAQDVDVSAPVAVPRQSAPRSAPKRPVQPAAITTTAPASPAPAEAEAAQVAPSGLPSAESMVQSARRSAGGIDKALRKESRPLIVAPLDSPQIRMRAGMEHARAMAPPRMWEAPKVEELVNNTGDGARRTRVITGNGTYCITNRAPTTNVEMIEMHGRQRFTSCPSDEEPPKQQVWRTARD